jgi:hypothetical protein
MGIISIGFGICFRGIYLDGNKNNTFPSKEEIIKALKEDKKPKGFEELIIILEFYRKSDAIGLIKGELRQNDEVLIRGKLTVFPKTMPTTSMWTNLDIGKSIYYGFSLEEKGETIIDLFSEGFRNSIRQGKIPFFHR